MISGVRINQLASILLIACFFLLNIIWVLPGTIAVRNILLFIALCIAVIFLISERKIFFLKKNIPLLILFSLFMWVIIHFFLFSLDSSLQLKEMKSLWIRTIGGAIIALALGLLVRDNILAQITFIASVAITPLINLVIYFYRSIEKGALIIPNEFVSRFLFNKIEAAFFGSIAIALCLAKLIDLLDKKFTFKSWLLTFFLLLSCFILATSSLVSSSKNGMIISLGLFALFALWLLYRIFSKKEFWGRYTLVAILFLFLYLLLAQSHKKTASPGWESILADIKVSIQIDRHQGWTHAKELFPLNEYGQAVAGNTYERVAWAVVGWRLILQEPLGYGSVNNSFKGMLNKQGIEHNVPGQTHSGWTDFTLAFGIPGILILITTQLAVIYFGLKNSNSNSLMGMWLCIALIPLGIIAEISYKQYFEATIFFITFATVMVAKNQISGRNL